jgi:hypothetical protein
MKYGKVFSSGGVVAMTASAPICARCRFAPHRALYAMTLNSARNDRVSSCARHDGLEWGETCDGWTIEQRYG